MQTKGRQATLVWELVHPQLRATTDCVAIAREDGQVELIVERGAVRQQHGVFAEARAAVRAAFEFEGSMIAEGWEKVV